MVDAEWRERSISRSLDGLVVVVVVDSVSAGKGIIWDSRDLATMVDYVRAKRARQLMAVVDSGCAQMTGIAPVCTDMTMDDHV